MIGDTAAAVWICATCGVEHPEAAAPPEGACAICSDDRQYLPPEGQVWTTHGELARDRVASVTELEPDLYALRVEPKVGIGHRGLLVRTPGGNLLWEPPGFLDDRLVDAVAALGGVDAIAVSHPHLVGAAVSWSYAFGGPPFLFNAADSRWICRPDAVVKLWADRAEAVPGVTLYQCGGHFPGSSVAVWPAGAESRGVLLTGDTVYVAQDRRSVSFMRSYPNLIPLPERLVRQISERVDALDFDRIYGGFDGQLLALGAKAAVQFSADRYLGWLRDEIRDPDEPAAP